MRSVLTRSVAALALTALVAPAFADPDALFHDDFESGAVCKWSLATGAPACTP